MNILKTRTLVSTWCGRKALSFTFHFDTKSSGKRVSVMQWADRPGISEIRVIKGDGRGFNFHELTKMELSTLDVETLKVEATRLAAIHFAK